MSDQMSEKSIWWHGTSAVDLKAVCLQIVARHRPHKLGWQAFKLNALGGHPLPPSLSLPGGAGTPPDGIIPATII
jgi:hypothetical protein